MISFVGIVGHAGGPLPGGLVPLASAAARSARPVTDNSVTVWTAANGAVALVGAGAQTLEGFRDDGDGEAVWLVGEPLLWAADGSCSVVTAATWRDGQALEYDGRFVALSVADGGLHVTADPSGMFPVYVLTDAGDGWTAVSPDPGLLRSLAGPAPTVDPLAAASLMTFGFSCGRGTIGGDIVRVAPSTTVSIDGSGRRAVADHPLRPDFAATGRGIDPQRAAAILQAVVAATVDHADKATLDLDVGLTAGRDSRLLLAALVSQGLRPRCYTAIHPDGYRRRSRDLRVGRQLAEITGTPHEVLDLARLGDYWHRPVELLREVAARADGIMSFEYTRFAREDRWARREAAIGGAGGEQARAYYGLADDSSLDAATGSVLDAGGPIRGVPLTGAGRDVLTHHVRTLVAQWADEGLALRLVNDHWYRYHDQRWTATLHAWANSFTRTVNPFLVARLYPDLVGGSDADRVAERFHRSVLAVLAPELLDVPFFAGRWERWHPDGIAIERPSGRTKRLGKLTGEARRRFGTRLWVAPLRAATDQVARALDSPGAPLWDTVDRQAMQRLVKAPRMVQHPSAERYLQRVASMAAAVER